MSDLEKKIQDAINSESAENGSNTPDYILAQYLMACLAAFNTATQQRETWYGRDARPSAPESPAKEQPGETKAAPQAALHPALIKLMNLAHELWDDGLEQSNKIILDCCEDLERALAQREWVAVGINDPTRQVAWIDNQARKVGICVGHYRYLLTLPPAPTQRGESS